MLETRATLVNISDPVLDIPIFPIDLAAPCPVIQKEEILATHSRITFKI